MTSAEPKRTSAYSQDIALRVVWMKLGMELTFRSIADRLQIGLGTTIQYVPLSPGAKADMEWWINNLTHHMCHPIQLPVASLTLQMDASTKGWGAYCQDTGQRTGGPQSDPEAVHHINWLELKAAFLAVQCFGKQGNHIFLLMDNRVAISYINQKGGTHSQKLCSLALDLWS